MFCRLCEPFVRLREYAAQIVSKCHITKQPSYYFKGQCLHPIKTCVFLIIQPSMCDINL